MENKPRETVADRLDRMYMKAMRCPYCNTKMERGTAKCENCGITKEQIYHANLAAFRSGKQTIVLRSKVRPASIPFWKMALGGMFGFTGAHCFAAKRWWRGGIILTCFLLFLVSLFMFPDAGPETDAHPVRKMFTDKTYLFPPDLLGIFVMILWVWDWVMILFGQFKYPVVIAVPEEKTAHE